MKTGQPVKHRGGSSAPVPFDLFAVKLDGRIDTDFLDRKAAQWREQQRGCLALTREHRYANRLTGLRKM